MLTLPGQVLGRTQGTVATPASREIGGLAIVLLAFIRRFSLE
jgi:hypothetical protein